MALRKILPDTDGALHHVCRPVPQITERVIMNLDDMKETMNHYGGVGVAASQIGILRRYFVAMPDPENNPEEVIDVINPEILELEGSQNSCEGCLSVEGLVGDVERPERVRIRYLDRTGKEIDREFTGFGATVICHEFDHLEGIVYTDKAENVRAAGEEEE